MEHQRELAQIRREAAAIRRQQRLERFRTSRLQAFRDIADWRIVGIDGFMNPRTVRRSLLRARAQAQRIYRIRRELQGLIVILHSRETDRDYNEDIQVADQITHLVFRRQEAIRLIDPSYIAPRVLSQWTDFPQVDIWQERAERQARGEELLHTTVLIAQPSPPPSDSEQSDTPGETGARAA